MISFGFYMESVKNQKIINEIILGLKQTKA